MASSSIEKDLREKAERFKHFATSHDRGVVVGAILSVLPVFPISVFGLLVSIYNHRLVKRGLLAVEEKAIVVRSIKITLITIPLGIVLLSAMSNLFSEVLNGGIFQVIFFVPDFLMDRLMDFFGLGRESQGGYSA